MDRQEEYELRQKISDAIAKDVSNVMADTLRACNSNFSLEIMYPLENQMNLLRWDYSQTMKC